MGVRALVVLAVVGAVFVEAPASAQWTAMVLQFEGRGSAAPRSAVISGIRDDVDLISTRDARSHDLTTDEGRAQAAADLGIAMYVSGAASGSRRRMNVEITVTDANGQVLSQRSAVMTRGRGGRRRVERAAAEAVQESIAALEQQAEEQRQAELAADRREIAAVDPELAEDDDDDDDDDGPTEASRYPFLEAFVLIGLRIRDADITLQSGPVRVYDATFGEAGLEAALHPFKASGSPLGGLFVRFAFAHSLVLSSTDQLSGASIGTTAFRLNLDAGYLHDLGPLSLGGSLGFHYDSFNLDPNTTMPTTAYTSLRPAVIVRVPIHEELIYAQADIGIRIAVGTGDLAPMFGTDASAFGFDIGALVGGAYELSEALGLAYGLRFSLVDYLLSFEGDGTPVLETAVDGSDLAIHLTALVGIRLD